MNYTEDEIVNDFGKFRAYLFGADHLETGVGVLGSPRGYSRHWDYIRELIKTSCPKLSLEFIDSFNDAVGDIASDHVRRGMETHEPLPKDFDAERYYFDHLKDALENVRRKNRERNEGV